MPQQTQIVPSHEHPHTQVVINDNTVFVDDIVREEFSGITTVFVTTADKGIDKKFVDIRSQEELDEIFGVANFKAHGQPLFNAQAFFNTPETRAFVMRATAEDAAYANTVVVAKVKVTPMVPAVDPAPATYGSLSVKIETLEIPELTSHDDITAELASLRTDVPDADGYLTFPLFAAVALGTGEYGNDLRVRLVKDLRKDPENSYTNYLLNVCEVQSTLVVKRTMTGSLYDAAMEDGEGIFLEDLVNDDDNALQKIKFFVDSDSLEALYDVYIENVDPETAISMFEFDYLYGLQRITSEPIIGYTVEPAGLDDFTLDSSEGVELSGGDDGLFDKTNLEAYNLANVNSELTYEDLRDAAFIAAFKGEIDPVINSKRRAPIRYLTDAAYSNEVKDAMVALFDKRRDFQLYLDAGILTTVAEAQLWLPEIADSAHHYGILREFAHYKIRDVNSGKKIPVTTMHFLHEELPAIFMDNISHPLAGTEKATISNMIKDSLLPVIDDNDLDLCEKFYKNNVVYYTCYGENLYCRATQETSQIERSDLSEENNVRILYDIQQVMVDFTTSKSYDFTSNDDRAELDRLAQEYVRNWYPGHVHSFEIRYAATAWEQKRRINHVYVAVTFKPLGKRSIVEIDVNPVPFNG